MCVATHVVDNKDYIERQRAAVVAAFKSCSVSGTKLSIHTHKLATMAAHMDIRASNMYQNAE